MLRVFSGLRQFFASGLHALRCRAGYRAVADLIEELGKVLVPAGRSGNLDLVDPKTLDVVAISGFSTSATFTLGAHDSGTTSADEGAPKLRV